MNIANSEESGRSMVEMIGVMAIMGLITAAGFVMVKSGMASQKQSRTLDEIEMLAANARNMTAGSETTCSLPSVDAVKGMGSILAKSILKTSGESPLGGMYSLTRSTSGATEECIGKGVDRVFVVYLLDIPEEDCTAMASRVYTSGSAHCEAGILMVNYDK